MSERFKVLAWKAGVGETLPGVRIPLSPPLMLCSTFFNILKYDNIIAVLAVLAGEPAVPCNLQPATAGVKSYAEA